MAELISIREYGRRHGCSDTNVHKAINRGHIVKGLVVKDGKKYIDPAIADKEWAENKSPYLSRQTNGGRQLHDGTKGTPRIEAEPETASLSKARAIKELYAAKTAQVEYDRLIGDLVPKKEVYSALFGFGQRIREAMLAIPSRVIDDILAASTRLEASNILDKAIRDALITLAEADNGSLDLKN